ncbi:MAG: DNA mismatch repair protein MutS, partial [Flavobacteriaceae bacterium]|nr:DNA mismatch repair protein MutS [Flavobacteriaceae bacterium]MCY4253849.1 DNA mismatch repair protein MutS [Flavobacteriaceae bacterium]
MSKLKSRKKTKNFIETPLMKQYREIKSRYPDAILLFRVGDFYETFGQDAITISEVLGIVLTKRNIGHASEIELAGFPHHSLDTYLPRLVKTKTRVAICEQLEDPKKTKTLVKRGVVELVTPGVQFNDTNLEQKENNFLCAVCIDENYGVAFLDASTGGFWLSQGVKSDIIPLVEKLNPSEVLVSKTQKTKFIQTFGPKLHCQYLVDWVFESDSTTQRIINHFQIQSLQSYGLHHMNEGLRAAGAILYYLSETHHDQLDHITSIKIIGNQDYMGLDSFTTNNLEIFHSTTSGGQTLISVIDKTLTPMGGRLMKSWLRFPLKE